MNSKKTSFLILLIGLVLAIIIVSTLSCRSTVTLPPSSVSANSELTIWDHDSSKWTETLLDGDTIGDWPTTGIGDSTIMATTPNDEVLVGVIIWLGAQTQTKRFYVGRYMKDKMTLWNHDKKEWLSDLANAMPLPTHFNGESFSPEMTVDKKGFVYMAFIEAFKEGNDKSNAIYLVRYNEKKNMEFWNQYERKWNAEALYGEPVHKITQPTLTSTFNPSGISMAVDSKGYVYITYGLGYRSYIMRHSETQGVEFWTLDGWSEKNDNIAPIDVEIPDVLSYFPRLAIDNKNRVYIVFHAREGWLASEYYTYLRRYNGKSMQIWDKDTGKFVDDIKQADPIYMGLKSPGIGHAPSIVACPEGMVYMSTTRILNGKPELILCRYFDEDGMRIWSKSGWVPSSLAGDRIDTIVDQAAAHPDLAVSKSGDIYIAYHKKEGIYPNTLVRVYLLKCKGETIFGWSKTSLSWLSDPWLAEPIDPGKGGGARFPKIVAHKNIDAVYVTYQVEVPERGSPDPPVYHIFLSRCMAGGNVQIWDHDVQAWSSAFGYGDPIDRGDMNNAYSHSIAAMDNAHEIYVSFAQFDGKNHGFCISRYKEN